MSAPIPSPQSRDIAREPFSQARLLCSVNEAKSALGVGHTTFYKLVGAGTIKTIKIGKKTCVVVQSLHDLVNGKIAA